MSKEAEQLVVILRGRAFEKLYNAGKSSSNAINLAELTKQVKIDSIRFMNELGITDNVQNEVIGDLFE